LEDYPNGKYDNNSVNFFLTHSTITTDTSMPMNTNTNSASEAAEHSVRT